MQLTDALRKKYEANFASMKINPRAENEALSVAGEIITHKARYDAIEKATGVPWFLVGCLHEREASCNFSCYLGDGEPLNSVTHCVPRGRGPFASFEAGAIDALTYEGFNKVKDWSLGSTLFRAEVYNGPGYFNRGLPSPYVWSGSNQYQRGKYAADGKYDASLVDPQLGVAVMVAALVKLGAVSFDPPNPGASPMATTSAVVNSNPVVAAAVKAATAPLKSIWSSITGMLSSIGGGAVATVLTTLAPNLTTEIVGALGIAFAIVNTAAHIYALVSGQIANNNATISLAENLLNEAEAMFGGKPFVFENSPSSTSAAAAAS